MIPRLVPTCSSEMAVSLATRSSVLPLLNGLTSHEDQSHLLLESHSCCCCFCARDVPSLSIVRIEALLAEVLLSLSQDHSGLRNIPSLPVIREKALLAEFLLSYDKIAVEQEGVQA